MIKRRRQEDIRLSQAAKMIGKSYNATLRLVFIGELEGRYDPPIGGIGNGRWIVDAASVEAYLDREPDNGRVT